MIKLTYENYFRAGHRITWKLVTIIYGFFIFFLCVIGSESLPRDLFFVDFIDVLYHFTGFCIFSFFLKGALYDYGNKNSLKYSLVIGILWAIICETAQLFVPTRSFAIADMTANLTGIILIQFLLKKHLCYN